MAVDRNGQEVHVGSRVRLPSLAPFLERNLPAEEWRDLQTMAGEVFEVKEIDEYGQPWIEKWWQDGDGKSHVHSLALDSQEMELVED